MTPTTPQVHRPEAVEGQVHPLIRLQNITKRFPGVMANDHIDLDIYAGEIHTLLGENGAGKTTLLNILAGMQTPDAGQILIHGQERRFRSPHEALACGIGTVYQHFTLVPNLSVIENVVLGTDTGFFLKLKEAEHRVREMMEKFGLTIDPHTQVQHLALGQQQRVEIIKVLYREPEVLLLDEPTSILTPAEVKELFRLLRKLKAEDKGVVFITHKLHEALELSDRITILANGKKIETLTSDTLQRQDKAEIADHIVKRMFGTVSRVETSSLPDVSSTTILRVENLTVMGSRGVPVVKNLSLILRAGEILGLAGVGGNGQKELGEALAGQRPAAEGRIYLQGVDLTNKGVAYARKQGIAYITDDRIEEGTVGDLSVAENAILRRVDEEPLSRRSMLNWNAIFDHTLTLIREFNIKVPSPKTPAGTLSGGNIQKLLLARELSQEPEVLICNQPTHGLDVKTAQFVWQTLREQAGRGKAILLISSDLDEIFSLSHRIGVMYNGELLDVLETSKTDRETIGSLMLGKRR